MGYTKNILSLGHLDSSLWC